MQVLENDKVVCFDVDDTLVMWSYPADQHEHTMLFTNYGHITSLLPHVAHIEALKQWKARGYQVVVWSAGGWEWAKIVVETLQLQAHVDLIMTKPHWMVDDIPPGEWTTRVYLKPGDSVWKFFSNEVDGDDNPEVPCP